MKKNNLDEMQEQKMLKIEHNGFWIAFWGLTAVIVVQALLGGYLDHIMGELAILVVLCFYTVFGCLKHGIWDRKLKPDRKTNLLVSLAAGAFIGIFYWIRLGKWFTNPMYLLITAFGAALAIFLLTFGLLSLCSHFYRKRRSKLDQE